MPELFPRSRAVCVDRSVPAARERRRDARGGKTIEAIKTTDEVDQHGTAPGKGRRRAALSRRLRASMPSSLCWPGTASSRPFGHEHPDSSDRENCTPNEPPLRDARRKRPVIEHTDIQR